MTATVHHGDALDLMRAMPDDSYDGMSTDPPYCSGGRQQAGARMTISKSGHRDDEDWFVDNMGTDSYLWWMREIAREALRVVRRGSQAHVFTDWRIYATLVNAWESVGWTLRSVVVWDKDRGGAMGSYWRNNHEWIAVFVKGKPKPLPHGSFFNTWRGTKPQGGDHPTEKPIDLMRFLVSAHSPPGGVILDPFAGSGTTLAAALLEGFEAVGIERELRFAEIARARCSNVEAGNPPAPRVLAQKALDFGAAS